MSAQLAEKSKISYDHVPYESYAYPQTQPPHLYTVGTLFGLTPPDFRTACVLEIGCASGGNLFPLAVLYPDAQFTGFDLSSEQISQANRQKEAMDLKNVTFQTQDILEFDCEKEKGRYDYIIAHGVFSWVPESVQSALLELCNKCLAPNGLAVVSYNTLPGWNAVRGLREMMIYHVSRFQKPEDKVRQARAFLDFLIESAPANSPHRSFLETERGLLQQANDSYLYHDHLEDMNTQFYLHEFVRQAHAKGLEYVGDTALASMFVGNLSQKAAETLGAVGDILAQEQYMDFVNNRRFRTTILCKKGLAIKRDLRTDQILNYYLTPQITPTAPIAAGATTASFNSNTSSGQFTTQDAASTTLFRLLCANGTRPIHARDLISQAAKEANVAEEMVSMSLINNGLQLLLRGFLAIHSDTTPAVMKAGPKPKIWPLARYQAAQPGCAYVTNMAGVAIKADAVGAYVMARMDGSHDVPALVNLLIKAVAMGEITATKEGKKITDGNEIRDQFEKVVTEMLAKLGPHQLLLS